jgi:hypothetical protein
VTTVIWALPLGYFLTQQSIGAREVLGAATIVVGLALFASFGHPAAGVNNAPTSDWVASILVICAACVALLIFANRGTLSTRAALLGTVAGLLYGLSATLMKPVVEGLHTEGLGDVVAGWQFWVWGAAGIIGFLFQQLSLATGRLVPSVAAVSVANPIVSVMLGALVLQERLEKNPPWHAVVAVGALCLALIGSVLISSARETTQEPQAEPEAQGPVVPLIYAARSYAPRTTRSAPITMSAIRATEREFASSHVRQEANTWFDRSGATTTTHTGAPMVTIDVTANTVAATAASAALTFAFRISASAARESA